jgi:hypothetical protein
MCSNYLIYAMIFQNLLFLMQVTNNPKACIHIYIKYINVTLKHFQTKKKMGQFRVICVGVRFIYPRSLSIKTEQIYRQIFQSIGESGQY